MKANKFKIAIQNKGKLREPSFRFFETNGLKFNPNNGRTLIIPCENSDIEILCVRHIDIPQYIHEGVADFGIIGENLLFEHKAEVEVIKKLGFGQCSLVIAAPQNSDIKSLADLEGERIATSYPNSLKKFLKLNNINACVIEIRGSVEITTSLNLADAICDITQTGRTLKENNLVQIGKILDSEAILIQNPHIKDEEKRCFKRVFATT
ncbi:MAG: ATP phosphoribosyltransferase [bacterium]